jgi:hypothetical protein
MGAASVVPRSTSGVGCRLVLRKEEGLTATLQFVFAGLEAGQQIFALAGPARLKQLANRLADAGLHPERLLHHRRLVFLTAPGCIAPLLTGADSCKRGSLLRNGSLLRLVSDWTWTSRSRADVRTILDFQRSIHQFIHSSSALSLCTVDGEEMERSRLLALLAQHRDAVKLYCGQEQ